MRACVSVCERVCACARLTEVSDNAVVFVHAVFEALQSVIDGAESQDDLGQLALQRPQLVIADGASNDTVSVQWLLSVQA